ncbi:ABC transporter ATP-binding protein [Kineococcus radiotolerans]|uniref:Oligopeptide/dipeptide ABC transporter, ATPase subunit n=1 Tax=Kineococcus radiotolerans (strain ATCC BAA-149 / DSM 14245 / SRS30216) TaxID=266940 RepID=A6WCB9_KINRD|nr:oligopeptide/dipeptide ABC transporter ATP-binding protein [Kineococcus radiotolerans]ABS04458.1 oligopeptide/dipeptide ABC transporter, ATPase subunit [Kineococcus radiotolerans SRS30216 = ATCC BAA-149]
MTRPTPDTAQPAREAAGEPLLSVRDLQVHYPIRSGVLRRAVGAVKAVDGVDLDVPRGTTYGLVGESGCGKSTLGRAVLRLSEPTGGSVRIAGRDLLGLGPEELRRARRQMQMVFQDPLASLDPRQTVESALVEPLAVHGVPGGPAAWRTRVRGLLDRVGLPAGAGAKYPHEFSGGQRQRVGIARALVLDPDLLVADEPVSALDVSVQAQVLVLLEELQRDLGLTYLVIAHDLAVVKHVSTTVGVMYLGGIVEEGTSSGLYARPLHPYTRALLSAAPVPDPVAEATRERILLAGDLPSPADPPSGCRFRTRCPWVQPTRCHEERPRLRVLEGHPATQKVACHFAEDIEAGRIAPVDRSAAA